MRLHPVLKLISAEKQPEYGFLSSPPRNTRTPHGVGSVDAATRPTWDTQFVAGSDRGFPFPVCQPRIHGPDAHTATRDKIEKHVRRNHRVAGSSVADAVEHADIMWWNRANAMAWPETAAYQPSMHNVTIA